MDEEEVPEYSKAIDNETLTITNSYEPETIEIAGEKTWDDAEDQDGLRPDSITILLYADGSKMAEKTVTEEDSWKWLFMDLPRYRDHGIEIIYTLTEADISGYETEIKDFDVINRHTPETVTVEGRKTWEDKDDQDGLRPESIRIFLLADGKTVESRTVTAEDGWAWSFTDLAKYRDRGTEIVYTIEEEQVEGYETVIEGYNVLNRHVPETVTVEGGKTWEDNEDQDGLRPESVTILLFADGVETDSRTVTVAEKWQWSFTDLPRYADGGKEIVYTIEEKAVEGYTTVIEGYDVVNIHVPETVSVPVTKVWEDENDKDRIRPGKVMIRLLADGEETEKVLELNADGDWEGAFKDLPKYKEHGQTIVYSISEDAVSDYTCVISGDADGGFTVRNSHTPKKPDVPETGDNTRITFWTLMMAGSLLCFLAVLLASRRKRNKHTGHRAGNA